MDILSEIKKKGKACQKTKYYRPYLSRVAKGGSWYSTKCKNRNVV